tara:strand:+ start:635 stop:1303 length:669 start_codon:yes stop_codon:yes gene_type:complete
MKYLCTSETLFSTINQLNEFRRAIGDVVIPAAERKVVSLVKSIENTFFKPTPALTSVEKEILIRQRSGTQTLPTETQRIPFTFEQPVIYPITPYRAPASTNSIVHTPPKEIMIPGRNRKGEIEPYRESKPKNAIEPYKFEKIKVDPDQNPIVKTNRDPDPKPREEEPKLKDKRVKGKFPFPFGGIDTPDRGAGSVNEPASISDLPLNLRVDSIGSYATRQRM